MARIDYWQYLIDKQGRPLEETEVRVYLAGTSTEANIYLDATFGSVTISSTVDLKTDKYGFVQFWIGDIFEVEGGYDVTQQFKIVWQNTIDSVEETIDDIYLFTPVRQINLGSIDTNYDKVISNVQGNKWDTHVDSIVPSASPHGLLPVTLFNLDSIQNRVISNKLGYQMYQMANTASTISTDISASRQKTQIITSWTPSGGKYYQDVTHNFSNNYPIVKINKSSNLHELEAEKIEAVSPDVTRIWLEIDIGVRVIILG